MDEEGLLLLVRGASNISNPALPLAFSTRARCHMSYPTISRPRSHLLEEEHAYGSQAAAGAEKIKKDLRELLKLGERGLVRRGRFAVGFAYGQVKAGLGDRVGHEKGAGARGLLEESGV